MPNCWAANIANRFEAHYPNGFKPTFYPEAFLSPLSLKKPAVIGCAFMGDLFGDWVDPEQRYCEEVQTVHGKIEFDGNLRSIVFGAIRLRPQHRFVFLTKCPQNLPKWNPWPDNCWVGVTATNDDPLTKALKYLSKVEAKVKYLSLEPMMGHMSEEHFKENGSLEWTVQKADVRWLIIGSRTKPVRHPERAWVEEIIQAADTAKIPIFIKEPLATHMGIHRQEMPMSKPSPFDISKPEEVKRLHRELLAYMKISVHDGTDFAGRQYAFQALKQLVEMETKLTAQDSNTSELVAKEIIADISSAIELVKCDPDTEAYFKDYYWMDKDFWDAIKAKWGVK